MSSVNGINSGSATGDAWAQLRAARAATQGRIQNQLLAKVDADGSGSVDGTELQAALDTIAKKTGASVDTNATDLLAKADKNGDGSLNAAELEKALQSALPPPSTMDFAQSRSADATAKAQAADDLFAKVDADGNGRIDKSELTALMAAMAQSDTTDTTSSTSTDTSTNDARFASLDRNGDGSLSPAEFAAGRPSGGAGGPGGPGGMPPPSGSAGDDTTYDPLDTNKDGVVSAAELAAAAASGATTTDPLAALFEAVDADGDKKLSVSETDALAKQVATALQTMQKSSSSSTGGDDKPFDLRTLAQLVLKQYEAMANNQSSTATSTLNATA